MDMQKPPTEWHLDQKEADLIVRNLWVAFNNFVLYGENHPLTRKAGENFYTHLSKILANITPVTIHLEHDTLVCEEWKVSERSFGGRLVTRLKDARVQSITFHTGIEEEDLLELIRVMSDNKGCPTVESMADRLHENKVKGLRFNYVTYERITIEESIVRNDLRKLAEVFSVGDIPSAGDVVADELLTTPSHVGEQAASSIAFRLKTMREHIGASAENQPDISTEDMLTTLSSLKKSILDRMQAEAEKGKIDEVNEDVITELERLTFEVIIRVVREEYRAGKITVKRLGEIIRRLLPEIRDLKRLLPQLKKTLIEEGMSLEEYLSLVRELAKELEEEGLVRALSEAAEEVGVSVDEIIDDVKNNPQSAVRLILLSAEIGSLMGSDSDQFRNLMTDYIEKVCSRLVQDAGRGETGENMTSREHEISRLETEFIRQLENYGLDRIAVSDIVTELDKLSGQESDDQTHDDLAQTQMHAIPVPDTGAAGGDSREPLQFASFSEKLKEHGFTQGQIGEFAELAADIQSMVGSNDDEIRAIVNNSIMNIGEVALDAGKSGADRGQTSKIIADLENRLLEQLSRCSIDPAVISEIGNRLAERMASIIVELDSEGMLSKSSPDRPISEMLQKQALAHIARQEADRLPDTSTFVKMLETKGLSEQNVKDFVSLASEIESVIGAEKGHDIRIVLLDYADRVAELSSQKAITGDASLVSSAVKQTLGGMEQQFKRFLKERKIDDDAVGKVCTRLSDSLGEIIGRLVDEGVLDNAPEGKMLTESENLQILAHIAEYDQKTHAFLQPLTQTLLQKGYPEEHIRQYVALAADIGSMLETDEQELQSVVQNYIERIGEQVAFNMKGTPAPQRLDALNQMNKEFVARLSSSGYNETVVQGIGNKVAEQLEKVVLKLENEQMLGDEKDVLPDAAPIDGARALGYLAKQDAGEGAGQTQYTDKGKKEKSESKKKKRYSLPKGIMRQKEFKTQIQREISRYRRYKAPFAVLSLSVESIVTGEDRHAPEQDDLYRVYDEVQSILSKMLRDLDCIGSLGSLGSNLIVILLSMTDMAGAEVVMKRLSDIFNTMQVPTDDQVLHPDIHYSITAYDTAKEPTLTAFIRKTKAVHKKMLEKRA
ncbi:MAG: hypothetical protein GF401_19805 [Chitinivibrionales bacterium]|nr:hypothetical protein [Chitinivibrionales bacterium]